MAKFQVPQFIEQKPKIVGPLTLQQFIYLASAAAVSFLSFYMFSPLFSVIITIVVSSVGLSLAFVKLEGQPLPTLIIAFLKYWQRSKKYTWTREAKTTEIDKSSLQKIEALRENMGFQNKLKSAAMDIATGNFSLFKEQKSTEEPDENYEVVTHTTGEKSVAKRVDYTK